MKSCQTFNTFNFDNLNISEETNNKSFDKLYKFILIDNNENINIIKAIEKSQLNKDKHEIIFNQFQSSQNELEKNIKSFKGIIYIYSENKKGNLDAYEIFKKIEKSLFKGKYFPKIIIGDKSDIQNFLIKFHSKKNKIKDMKHLVPDADINIELRKGVEALIIMGNIYEKYQNFLMMNQINENNILNKIKNSRLNILKCKNCNKIYEISLDNNSNDIILNCNHCQFNLKLDINNFEKISTNIYCYECRKQLYENKSLNYCFICKNNICNECVKKHCKKEENDFIKNNDIIYQNNIIDVLCNKHYKICYNHCIECEKNICIDCELDNHFNHQTKLFEYNRILSLINKQKKSLEQEKEKFKKIKDIIKDCINSLKKYFNNLLLFKEKEINLKEKIIQQLELFKFDNTLIENVKNLKFNNYETSYYNCKDSLDKKINYIFQFFNEPFKIENTKIFLSENIKGPFDILRIYEGNNSNPNKYEKVTDICALHNYKDKNHFAVSYNNGLLKIYNDDFKNRIPINIIKVFKENKEIIFMHKTRENYLLLVGIYKVKQIYLSENFLEHKIINEFKIKDQIFKMVIDIFSFHTLMVINNFNQIFFYDYSKENILSDKLKDNEFGEGKEISFIDKISENQIILNFISSNNILELNYKTKEFSLLVDENNNINNKITDFSNNSSLIINNYQNYQTNKTGNYWKIFEFEMKESNIQTKKSYTFKYYLCYLGKINNKSILLFNKNLKKILLFDLTSYSNVLEIPFKNYKNPLLCYNLNKKFDFVDLLFINEEGCLAQYSLNKKLGILLEIETINIIDKKIKPKNKIENECYIVKMINLSNNTFLFLNKDNYLIELKDSSCN